jgi:type I restriction enzyme, S subunit
MREGWSEVLLGDVLALDLDKVSIQPEASYPMAGVYSFGRGLFEREVIGGKETSYSKLHRLRPGQLVFSRLFGWEGAIAPVTDQFAGYFLSPEFPTFTPTDALSIEYLTLLTQQPSLWYSLRRQSVGLGSRRSRVKVEAFLRTRILVPPQDDQRRIVDLANAFDTVIDKAAKAVGHARLAAESLGRRLLDGRGPQAPLGEAVLLTLGKQVSQARRPGDRLVAYLRAANVQDGHVRVTDVKKMPFTEPEVERFRLKSGDVLVQEGGTPPGTTSAWHGELDGDVCIQNSLIRLRARPGTTIAPYVEVLARWCHETGRFAAQGRRTHGIAHLGLNRASAIPVPVPDLPTQQSISDLVGAVRTAADSAKRAHHQAVRARAAAVGALLTGSHVIPPAYDLAAFDDGEAVA